MINFATNEQICDHFARTSFQPGPGSDPSVSRIMDMAELNSSDLIGIVTGLGYPIPTFIGNPNAYRKLAEMNAEYVAWKVHYILWNKIARVDKCPAGDALKEAYDGHLKLLLGGYYAFLFAPDTASPDALQQFGADLLGQVSDDEPWFTRNDVF